MGRNLDMDPADRWWLYVEKGPTCWRWTGATDSKGYGGFYVGTGRSDRKTVRAHRFGYEALVGPIPATLDLDHLCENRWCVNPAHLRPATRRENVGRALGRTVCKRGHSLTDPANLYVQPSNGKRFCLACRAHHSREHRHRAALRRAIGSESV